MKFSVFAAALLACAVIAAPAAPAVAKPYKPSVAAASLKKVASKGKVIRNKAVAGRKADSKARGPKNIAKIRDAAIRSSVAGLGRLRNYSTNYGALLAAVKGYWMRNVTRPNAGALAAVILRYVQPEYRKYAASEVRAGAAEGVASVKLALRHS